MSSFHQQKFSIALFAVFALWQIQLGLGQGACVGDARQPVIAALRTQERMINRALVLLEGLTGNMGGSGSIDHEATKNTIQDVLERMLPLAKGIRINNGEELCSGGVNESSRNGVSCWVNAHFDDESTERSAIAEFLHFDYTPSPPCMDIPYRGSI